MNIKTVCPNCGATVPNKYTYCNVCGRDLTPRVNYPTITKKTTPQNPYSIPFMINAILLFIYYYKFIIWNIGLYSIFQDSISESVYSFIYAFGSSLINHNFGNNMFDREPLMAVISKAYFFIFILAGIISTLFFISAIKKAKAPLKTDHSIFNAMYKSIVFLFASNVLFYLAYYIITTYMNEFYGGTDLYISGTWLIETLVDLSISVYIYNKVKAAKTQLKKANNIEEVDNYERYQ